MTESAEITMVLYAGLSADEESVLKGLEQDVMEVLLKHHVTSRPMWESRIDDAKGRFVRLYVLYNPNPLLELLSSHIASLSPPELRARLEESLQQH